MQSTYKLADVSFVAMTTLYFSSSSSEDEDEYYKDVQLRRDIHQLERALNNVDTKSDLSKHNQVSDASDDCH